MKSGEQRKTETREDGEAVVKIGEQRKTETRGIEEREEDQKEADAVYAMFTGRQRFSSQQYQEFGLKGKLPCHRRRNDYRRACPSGHGDEVIGVITALHYSEALENPANKKFVKAFVKRPRRLLRTIRKAPMQEPDGLWRRSRY